MDLAVPSFVAARQVNNVYDIDILHLLENIIRHLKLMYIRRWFYPAALYCFGNEPDIAKLPFGLSSQKKRLAVNIEHLFFILNNIRFFHSFSRSMCACMPKYNQRVSFITFLLCSEAMSPDRYQICNLLLPGLWLHYLQVFLINPGVPQ